MGQMAIEIVQIIHDFDCPMKTYFWTEFDNKISFLGWEKNRLKYVHQWNTNACTYYTDKNSPLQDLIMCSTSQLCFMFYIKLVCLYSHGMSWPRTWLMWYSYRKESTSETLGKENYRDSPDSTVFGEILNRVNFKPC